MRTFFVFSGLLFVMAEGCLAQVCGCTDSLATNYNPNATVNDGSCLYAPSIINASEIGLLNAALDGTSTLIYWNNGYWTYNDHLDWRLYRIDSTNATIQETLYLKEIRNEDTEEIAQDSLHLYFGDIGNNICGCRNNLKILRVSKKSLLNQILKIDTIAFSYEDQTYTAEDVNATDFDCEAFIVTDDSIYLFTKEWISHQTTLYSLPKTPGTHVAHRRGTYNVQGLVTGATYLPEYRLVILCGYDYNSSDIVSALHPFIVLLYDFQDNNFFSGNKRRLDFETTAKAQVEAIATANALDYYITNEHLNTTYMGVININIPAKLQRLDLREYLVPYLSQYMDSFPPPPDSLSQPDTIPPSDGILNPHNGADGFHLYPNPTKDKLHIDYPPEFQGAEYAILNLNGQKVAEGILKDNNISLNINYLSAGRYILAVRKNGKTKTFSFIKKE